MSAVYLLTENLPILHHISPIRNALCGNHIKAFSLFFFLSEASHFLSSWHPFFPAYSVHLFFSPFFQPLFDIGSRQRCVALRGAEIARLPPGIELRRRNEPPECLPAAFPREHPCALFASACVMFSFLLKQRQAILRPALWGSLSSLLDKRTTRNGNRKAMCTIGCSTMLYKYKEKET